MEKEGQLIAMNQVPGQIRAKLSLLLAITLGTTPRMTSADQLVEVSGKLCAFACCQETLV